MSFGRYQGRVFESDLRYLRQRGFDEADVRRGCIMIQFHVAAIRAGKALREIHSSR